MKFTVTFKSPDAADDALKQNFNVTENNLDELTETTEGLRLLHDYENAQAVLARHIADGEYVTIQFDTDAKTATVLPKGR